MKRMITVFCLMSVAMFNVAKVSANDIVSNVTVSTFIATKYLGSCAGVLIYNNPVVQSDLFITLKHGFYLDLWNSTSLDTHWNNNFGDEIDYGAGWDGEIAGFNIHLGFTYYDEPRIFTLGDDDIFNLCAKVSKDLKVLTATVGFESYITTPSTGYNGGNLCSIGVSRSQSFLKDRLTLSASDDLVYDDGGFGFDNGFLLRGTVGANWVITKNWSLNAPSMRYFVPFGVKDDRKIDAMFSAGISYTF